MMVAWEISFRGSGLAGTDTLSVVLVTLAV